MRKDWSKYSTPLLIDTLNKTDGSIEKCDIICELVARDCYDSAFEAILSKLSESNQVFWNNYMVADFADAAKDIMGFKKYSGERQEVKTLIQSQLDFT